MGMGRSINRLPGASQSRLSHSRSINRNMNTGAMPIGTPLQASQRDASKSNLQYSGEAPFTTPTTAVAETHSATNTGSQSNILETPKPQTENISSSNQKSIRSFFGE